MVFSFDILGHHLEYVHHLYEKFRRSGEACVFVVPERFEELRGKLLWEAASNIRFDLISREETDRYEQAGTLRKRFLLAQLLGNKIRQHRVCQVFCLYLSPFTSSMWMIPSGAVLSGIVYQIPLYREQVSFLRRLRDFQEFSCYARNRKFGRVYLLNDPEGAERMNRKYRTEKFVGLPDPYLPLAQEHLPDIRARYGIPQDRTLFVHLGAMTWGKGTMDILHSLKGLGKEESSRYWFFFAGKVGPDIKSEFDASLRHLQGIVDITLVDDFCEYDFFAALCQACDALVLPYHRTSQSSGIIGYASQFGKPVIAPGKGLLGNLIRKYALGYMLEEVSVPALQSSYRAIAAGNVPAPTRAYCEANTVSAFMESIQV